MTRAAKANAGNNTDFAGIQKGNRSTVRERDRLKLQNFNIVPQGSFEILAYGRSRHQLGVNPQRDPDAPQLRNIIVRPRRMVASKVPSTKAASRKAAVLGFEKRARQYSVILAEENTFGAGERIEDLLCVWRSQVDRSVISRRTYEDAVASNASSCFRSIALPLLKWITALTRFALFRRLGAVRKRRAVSLNIRIS